MLKGVGGRFPSEPPIAAGQILLGPPKQTEERKIRKNLFIWGKEGHCRKGRAEVVYCPVSSLHDVLVWKKKKNKENQQLIFFSFVVVESQHDISSK